MPGTLFLVATPIGNLEDVTLRALRVLREADLIAAEDTRHTAKLLRHYQIQTPTTSFHEHNEGEKIPSLLRRLESGEKIALVSDAGTPAISDPGFRLVQAARRAGMRVEAIPGPSAVITALITSGLPTDSFAFVGFPPSRASARHKWLAEVAAQPRTVVFFEAPHRIRATLAELATHTGDARQVAVARELTKIHENLVDGPIRAVLDQLDMPPRGEFTVIVAPADRDVAPEPTIDSARLLDEFGEMTNSTELSRREIVQTIASKYRLSTKSVYESIEQAKKSG
jgi:16S rRNA (cytidine1402-2'-O)-methyltransferase